MKLETLDALTDTDLIAIIARSEELLKQHDRERKEKALEQAAAILQAAGLSLHDIGAKPKRQKRNAASYHGGHRYQHPADKAKIWDAKGQKPNWLRELEGAGGKPVELPPDVGNDDNPGGKQAKVSCISQNAGCSL